MKKTLKAAFMIVVLLIPFLFAETTAFAEGNPGYVYIEPQPGSETIYHTDFTGTPDIAVEEASDYNGIYIGPYNNYRKLSGYSIMISFEEGDYRARAFRGNAADYNNQIYESGFRAYDWNGKPYTVSQLKDFVKRRQFQGVIWVKGNVTEKIFITVSTSPEEHDYSVDGRYYLDTAVFKQSGNVISVPDLRAYVEIEDSEITDDYISKPIKLTGNLYKLLDPSVTAKVKITNTPIDESTLPHLSFSTLNRFQWTTGYPICPEIPDDVQYSVNGVVYHLYKGTDFDVSYENNFYPTTDDNPAYAKLTFKGHYKGERKLPFTIKKGSLKANYNFTVDDWFEGDTPSTPVVECERFFMAANEPGEITYTYYKGNSRAASEAELLPGVPTEAGEYFVKAYLPEGILFAADTFTASFTIKEKPVTPPPTEDPNDPGNPDDPGEIDTPDDPEDPDEPGEIDTPDNPENPDEPGEIDTPDDPEDPDEPGEIDTPDDQGDTGNTGSTDDNGGNQNTPSAPSTNPSTGNNTGSQASTNTQTQTVTEPVNNPEVTAPAESTPAKKTTESKSEVEKKTSVSEPEASKEGVEEKAEVETKAEAETEVKIEKEAEPDELTNSPVNEPTETFEETDVEITKNETPLSDSIFSAKNVGIIISAFAIIGAALYFLISKLSTSRTK